MSFLSDALKRAHEADLACETHFESSATREDTKQWLATADQLRRDRDVAAMIVVDTVTAMLADGRLAERTAGRVERTRRRSQAVMR
jgi:hypothetical protein